MVSVAIAVACWDIGTSAVINGAGSIANTTVVELSHAVVCIVTNSILIGVGGAVATAVPERIELIAIAVAVFSGDALAPTVVDGAGAVADPAVIELSYAVVHVVTDAVGIGVGGAVTAAVSEGVELVSIAVAVAFGNVDASTVINGAGSVAYSAIIELSNTVVHVVTDAIGIGVGGAAAATNTEDIEFISIAVAGIGGHIDTSTVINLTWAVTNATVIELTNTEVHIVANAIRIDVDRAVPSANANGVELISIAIAILCWNVGASAFVNGAGPVADSAIVKLSYAVIHVVTDAIGIGVSGAVTAAVSEGVVGQTGPVFVCSIRIVVACGFVGAARDFF